MLAGLALAAVLGVRGVRVHPGVPPWTLASPAFSDGGRIPAAAATREVRGGRDRSLPLRWGAPPKGTRSLALAMVDLAPIAHHWVHWLVIDLAPRTHLLLEGASRHAMPSGSRELVNSFGQVGYGGPQPPPGSGLHPYRITLYALDVPQLALGEHASLADFETAVRGHVLASTAITGIFER